MSNPFIGEIRMFGGSFAPAGWAFCSGQSMAISENDALFTLIGTTYGGDGQATFNLPNLNGRVPVHLGSNYQLGETGGTETVTITTSTMPNHTHPFLASENTSTSPTPNNNIIGKSTAVDMFINAQPTTPLANGAIQPIGGSQPHENMQPYLVVSYIISLFGLFPTQN